MKNSAKKTMHFFLHTDAIVHNQFGNSKFDISFDHPNGQNADRAIGHFESPKTNDNWEMIVSI